MHNLYKLSLFLWLFSSQASYAQNGIVVFQSDFGLKDGAVSAMKGVAMGVSPALKLFDLTHDIPAYNIWEAAYRLHQTVPYYPKGTVFVSVCDPGVGTERHSVVLLTKTGHYIVTPDNGTLTLVAEHLGIGQVRQIDEAINRLRNSNQSYTFHGRDVYAYTAARLASHTIRFEQVGPKLPNEVVRLPYQKAEAANGMLKGTIPVLDIQYGNVWSNIPKSMIDQLGIKPGGMVRVQIFQNDQSLYDRSVAFVNTFGEAAIGDDVAYINSLLNFSIAVNQGNFSEKYKVFSGPDWKIVVSKTSK
ncbi:MULTISPECIES: S-adenosyl-l-methionine hydroxide adenosyltransferase family protein [unclassified Spirosoma]|uniref:SAM hydrolase/SAM-dependent halogenase family protein n=1 Tax=unclassified Spirosoma TaxID=2621999 RepID=UPI0009630CE3|nr:MULTISPECIES: S-adenosyl-l-methionine hydroxide adenosyltransferase family protein [unclassified Spirosoma]MBN8823216.1 S-adenosyl-l-methionine hydroxide adenosyltransferase family protein [Spirosoma sp.]OJW72634.1 MAG: DNA-directed RNA polymerase subunit delta [Spirosoma sp. 48-14]